MDKGAETLTVGWLGLGAMGMAMVQHIIKAGYKVVVWNRSMEKSKSLEAAGAKAAASPKELAASSDIMFSMMPNEPTALTTAEQVSMGMSPGKGFVDLTTVGHATAQQVAKVIHRAGGLCLDSPVSGSVGPAAEGKLIFMASGDKLLYDKAQPLLELMGSKKMFLGQTGSASQLKGIINMFMGSTVAALAEALALAKAAGVEQEMVIDVIGSGALNAPIFKIKGEAMRQRQYPTLGRLQYQLKDMKLALDMGAENHVRLPLAAAATALYSRADSAGFGEQDSAAVIEATYLD